MKNLRFTPTPGQLHINAEAAEHAIRAYNSDRKVVRQESAAFNVLSNGFTHGNVLNQLRRLNTAYSTRAVGADLVIISQRIETAFDRWKQAASEATPLLNGVADDTLLRELLGYYLDDGTRRKGRSLATKALHFAAPGAFIPADRYAVNHLGDLLQAGSWKSTSGMGTGEMATWYASYLQACCDVAATNCKLAPRLFALDLSTAPWPGYERFVGWPKLLDKLLWWSSMHRESPPQVFQFERQPTAP